MNSKDDEFLKRLQETFRIEAQEHLQVFSAGLIEIGKTRAKKRIAEIIDTLFREIHSLKGAARSVDQKEIESVCHPVEALFSDLKRYGKTLSQTTLDVLFMVNEQLLKLVSTSGIIQSPADRQLQVDLIKRIKELNEKYITPSDKYETNHVAEIQPVENTTSLTSGPEVPTAGLGSAVPGVVRVPVSKLEPLLLQAEEMIQTKIAGDQRILELKEINNNIVAWKSAFREYKRLWSEKTRMSFIQWIETTEANILNLETRLSEITHSIVRDQRNQSLMINDHLADIKHLLMLPLSTIIESFPSMVRKISREQNKEIELIIHGEEMVIDKRILEELKDPLIHLIRNSIDHGIGKPSERIKQNKPSCGTIILSFASHKSGMVEIIVSDDGAGIDIDRLLKQAIKSGNLSVKAGEKLNREEILSLIFEPGVTTSPVITDISGRGLGLAIVREKVQKLNGSIVVETDIKKGTTFNILLPMTLTAYRGVLVKKSEYLYVIPTMNVERAMELNPEMIKTVENHETILFDGRIIPLADLGETLGIIPRNIPVSHEIKTGTGNSNKILVVVIASGEHFIAFKVDEIVEEIQILVKGLGKLLKHVKNISGATISGSGKVVPVIQITDLIKSAQRSSEKVKIQHASETKAERIKTILVAEDSITARTLLKNILETAGYQVSTAIDGSDAFARLRSGEFDLVVSDIDMPVMNGFELTQKIRENKKLSDIPVVLVTALESREDRERGIDVGADAYIVKSSFDQNNLLDIIKKLI